MSLSADQVESLVLQSLNQSSPHAGTVGGGVRSQQEATRILQEWTAADTNTQSSNGCNETLLQVLQQQQQHHSQDPNVVFFALATLERRLAALSGAQRCHLQSLLLTNISSSSISVYDLTYIQNKVALILAKQVFILDNASSSLEQDLLLLASRNPNIFLRTVDTLLQELGVGVDVVGDDTHTVNEIENLNRENVRRIKNALKGFEQPQHQPLSNGCVSNPTNNIQSTTTPLQNLLDCVTSILATSMQPATSTTSPSATSATPSNNIHTSSLSDPALATLALQCTKTFLVWTAFFASHQQASILDLLLVVLLHYQNEPQLALVALECWQEYIVHVAATASCASTNLLDQSNNNITSAFLLVRLDLLLEKLHAILPVEGESTADIEVVIQVAKLIDTIGLEMMLTEATAAAASSVQEQSQQPDPLRFQKVLDLFFRAFRYDDIDVSTAVLSLAARLVAVMQGTNEAPSTTNITANLRQHLPQLVNILYQQLKYPPDFGYDYEDEEDAEEEVYRAELCKLYIKIVRAAPGPTLEFVCHAVQASMNQSSGSIAQAPTPNVEAMLRLVYNYCEGIRPPPGLKVVMNNEAFCNMIVALHCSDISNHPHRQVLCLYYDVAVRYYPIFGQQQEELLHKVLAAMSGPCGLQHPHPRVRSRCCYLLLRLVKSVVKLLRPYVETAVTNLLATATASCCSSTSSCNGAESLLRSEDTLYLFETMGHLLGRTGLDESQQQVYLTQLMTPHVRSVDEILSTPGLTRDVEHFGEILSVSIAAMVHLSKGFTDPPNGVRAVLVETVRVALRVHKALPASEQVRNKSMVLVQRMIQCVGSPVLPLIPEYLFLLIAHCTVDDILFVSQIFNQLCVKFKAETVAVIDAALLPFLRKCHALVPVQEEDADSGLPPHLRTEQIMIQKISFAVLQHIVSHNATAVLVSPTNVGSLETVLRTMLDGATHINDPAIKKTCIKFYRELVDQWAGGPSYMNNGQDDVLFRRGFMTFTCQCFVPEVLESFMDPSFDERDAMEARNVTEFAHVLWGIKTKSESGEELYQQSVVAKLSATGRIPTEILEYLRSASSYKDIDTCLGELLKRVKRGENTTMT